MRNTLEKQGGVQEWNILNDTVRYWVIFLLITKHWIITQLVNINWLTFPEYMFYAVRVLNVSCVLTP